MGTTLSLLSRSVQALEDAVVSPMKGWVEVIKRGTFLDFVEGRVSLPDMSSKGNTGRAVWERVMLGVELGSDVARRVVYTEMVIIAPSTYGVASGGGSESFQQGYSLDLLTRLFSTEARVTVKTLPLHSDIATECATWKKIFTSLGMGIAGGQ